MKQLLVFVYRNANNCDCSANGVTSKYKQFTLLYDCSFDEAKQWVEENDPSRIEEYLYSNPRVLWGKPAPYAEPLQKKPGTNQMFGGNFVYTTDSRFQNATYGMDAPLKVFDRFEQFEY
jgi:hypothetical protein